MGKIKEVLGNVALEIHFAPAIISTGVRKKVYDLKEDRKDKKVLEESNTRSDEETKTVKKDIKEMAEVLVNNAMNEGEVKEISRSEIIRKTTRTLTLIDYAEYYITTPNPRLIKLDRLDRRFVNFIANYLGYKDPIFKIEEKEGDLEIDLELYDPNNDRFDIKAPFCLDIGDLDARKGDKLNEKINKKFEDEAKAAEEAKKAQEEAAAENGEEKKPDETAPEESKKDLCTHKNPDGTSALKVVDKNTTVCSLCGAKFTTTSQEDDSKKIIYPDFRIKKEDEDGKNPVHPLFIMPEDAPVIPAPVFPKYQNTLTKEEIEKLKVFDELGLKCDFRFEKFGDIVWIIMKRAFDIEEKFIVDMGNIMGKDQISVLANTYNDNVFVNISHKDLVRNALDIALYKLNPNEVQLALTDYFRNAYNYRYIDMSNTGFLADLSYSEFQKLGKKLTFINQRVREQNNPLYDLPRFRFEEWKSVDDFTIVSDSEVVSPLAITGKTSSVIVDGLRFKVSGDDITQTYLETEANFHIDQYGEM